MKACNSSQYLKVLWFALVSLALNACKNSDDDAATKIHQALSSDNKKMPGNLGDTHLFFNGNPDTPTFAIIPYDVRVSLWVDSANKKRYIFVPPGRKISYDAAKTNFQFPIGTTFVKHFTTSSSPEFPIETRIITLKPNNTWRFASYVWNDDGSAELNTRPRKVSKNGLEYRIPSEQECQSCHGNSGIIRGFTPRQLNFALANGQNQIAALKTRLEFQQPMSDFSEIKPLDQPSDSNFSISERTRSYMEVNCSPCHNPLGPEKANKLDMRLDAIDTHLLGEAKIVPGDLSKSILWKKISAATERMPPLSLRSDPLALELFRQYIEQSPK